MRSHKRPVLIFPRRLAGWARPRALHSSLTTSNALRINSPSIKKAPHNASSPFPSHSMSAAPCAPSTTSGVTPSTPGGQIFRRAVVSVITYFSGWEQLVFVGSTWIVEGDSACFVNMGAARHEVPVGAGVKFRGGVDERARARARCAVAAPPSPSPTTPAPVLPLAAPRSSARCARACSSLRRRCYCAPYA